MHGLSMTSLALKLFLIIIINSMLRIINMKNETNDIDMVTPTQVPRILEEKENQLPPKKQQGSQRPAGSPSCKKVLFLDSSSSDSDSDDEDREVIKPWDSGPTRGLLIGIVSAWGNMSTEEQEEERQKNMRRIGPGHEKETEIADTATPETHTAFVFLGKCDDDDDDEKEMASRTQSPMTPERLHIAQLFCKGAGDVMECKHLVLFLDATLSNHGRPDVLLAIHKQDITSLGLTMFKQFEGLLVNATDYYADKGKAEWSEEFVAKNRPWLTAQCIAVYRRGDIEMREAIHQRIKEQEDHPMQYVCGYDKSDLGDGDKGADMWRSILRVLDIPVDSVKGIPFAMNRKKSSFHWIGKDIEIMTEHNPLTGEAFDKQASSEGRIGFAGYVGVRCLTKSKRDLVLALFASMPNIFGGETKDSLEYIGFHGCGGGEKRKREAAATDKKGKTKTAASAVPLKRSKST